MPAQPFSVDYDAATGLATLRPRDGGTVLIERVNPSEIVFRVRAADDGRAAEDGAAVLPASHAVPILRSPVASSSPSSPTVGSPGAAYSPQAGAAPVSRRSSVNGDTVASSPEGAHPLVPSCRRHASALAVVHAATVSPAAISCLPVL